MCLSTILEDSAMHYLPNQCLPAYICLNYNLHWLILSFFLFQIEIFVPSENNYLEWKYLLQMKIFVPNENICSKWKYLFQMKIFVPNKKCLFQIKIFVPNKNVSSKRKYLFQMEIFVPNGFIFSKRIYFCTNYKLRWFISSAYFANFWTPLKWKYFF